MPPNLAMAPVMTFTEAVTQRGAARAQELLQSMLEDIRVESPATVPRAKGKRRWNSGLAGEISVGCAYDILR